MMSLWKNMAPREQLLLTLAAVVVVIAIIVQFGLVPLLDRRDAARLNLSQSNGTLVRLEKLKAVSATYRPAVPVRTLPESVALASQWATETGMTFVQDEASATQPRFTFTRVDPTTVFAWIERVENELGLAVFSAELISSERGMVGASIVFSEGPES